MLGGIGNNGAAQAATQAVNSAPMFAGSANTEGAPAREKDAGTPSTDPKFGEVLQQIQTKFGAKPEKPREIKKVLGKDDFLRIMITQMKHQDPTSPFKAEQFATEMAQFTSVEQMQNMNQALNKMANQNAPLERLATTNLIGKTITIDRDRFPHVEGTPDSLNYALPKDAANVHAAIISETGEVVLEKDLGGQKAGENSFSWDGLKSNTLAAKSGGYILRIEAKDASGASIDTNSRGQGRVIGVSFEGNEAILLLGDPNHPEKVTLRNVVRIDADAPGIPGAQSLAQTVAAQGAGGVKAVSPEKAATNFMTFQKGVGSANADPANLPPEAAEALAKFQAQQAAASAPSAEDAAAAAQSAAAASQLAEAKGKMLAQIQADALAREKAMARSEGSPPGARVPGAAPNPAQARAAYADAQKGFPNGLHDGEESSSPPGSATGAGNGATMKKGGEQK